MSITVATLISRIGYKIYRNSTQTIGAATQPNTAEVVQWINDSIQILRQFFVERKAEFGLSDGYITTSKTAQITNVTLANPCVVTTSEAHGFSTGDAVYHCGLSGMIELNHNTYKIIDLTDTTYSLQTNVSVPVDIDSTSYTSYTGSGIATKNQYYTTLAALMYAPADWGVLYDGSSHYPLKRIHYSRTIDWSENDIAKPQEFRVDESGYIYLFPWPDAAYPVKIPYWEVHTALNSGSTLPFSEPFAAWVEDAVVKIFQNRNEYEQVPVDQRAEFMAIRNVGNYIKAISHFPTGWSA